MLKVIVKKPDEGQLEELGVSEWPVWVKEASVFDWEYSTPEVAYILKGHAKVTSPFLEKAVEFGPGDLVKFPTGLKCTWQITEPIKKHYNFKDIKI